MFRTVYLVIRGKKNDVEIDALEGERFATRKNAIRRVQQIIESENRTGKTQAGPSANTNDLYLLRDADHMYYTRRSDMSWVMLIEKREREDPNLSSAMFVS